MTEQSEHATNLSPHPVFAKKTPEPQQTGLAEADRRWLVSAVEIVVNMISFASSNDNDQVHHTEYSEPELNKMYDMFKHDYPRGGMFRQIFFATLKYFYA